MAALREIAYYKDRAREDSRRVMAYRKAADVVESLDEAARDRHAKAGTWQSLPGIGPKTAKVITQAVAGQVPDALVELRSAAEDLGAVTSGKRSGAICTVTRTGRMAQPRSRR